MEIWFEEVPQPLPATAAGPARPGGSNATSEPPENPLARPLEQQSADEPIERRFRVRCDLVQSRVLIRDREAEPAELMLEGDVQLDEIPLVPTSDQPMRVTGDRIKVVEAHTPNTGITAS